jgi:hypothetical protein
MSSGVAGGRIGGAIARSLERRYGPASANIGVGIVVALGALVLAALYFEFQPVITEADVSPSEVQVSRYNVRQSALDIWSDDRLYTARPRFWRPALHDEVLEQALAANRRITLWLYPGKDEIFGLKAGNLYIPTSAGVVEYMSNRFWFLALWVGFLVGGFWTLAHGLWLRSRRRPTIA